MDIITREEWGAMPPKSQSPMSRSRRDRIFGHWPAMPSRMSDHQMLLSAQRYHMSTLKWSDIAYSWAIGRDGKTYELRGFGIAGGHTRGENDDSYGILFLLGEDEAPTKEMLAAFPHLVEYIRTGDLLMGEREDVVVVGHRHDDEANTSCPGPDLAAFLWDYNHARDYQPIAATPVMANKGAQDEPKPEVDIKLSARVDLLEIQIGEMRAAIDKMINTEDITRVFRDELKRLAEG